MILRRLLLAAVLLATPRGIAGQTPLSPPSSPLSNELFTNNLYDITEWTQEAGATDCGANGDTSPNCCVLDSTYPRLKTSYSECRIRIELDLSTSFDTGYLDSSTPPTFYFTVTANPDSGGDSNPDSAGYFFGLGDSAGNALTSCSSAENGCVSGEATSGTAMLKDVTSTTWSTTPTSSANTVEHVLSAVGARYVRIILSGKDSEYWAGTYGAVFTGLSVRGELTSPPSPPPLSPPQSPPSPPPCTATDNDRDDTEAGCCSGLSVCVEARSTDDADYCDESDPEHGVSCFSEITMCRAGPCYECIDRPLDTAEATFVWCVNHCSGCNIKVFSTEGADNWEPSDDGFSGCVCVVVDGVPSPSMTLSDYDDCVVAVNGGSLNGVYAGEGDDLICGGVFDDTIYGARRPAACALRAGVPSPHARALTNPRFASSARRQLRLGHHLRRSRFGRHLRFASSTQPAAPRMSVHSQPCDTCPRRQHAHATMVALSTSSIDLCRVLTGGHNGDRLFGGHDASDRVAGSYGSDTIFGGPGPSGDTLKGVRPMSTLTPCRDSAPPA